MPKLKHDESMQYGPGAGKRNDNKLKHHRSSTPLRTSPSLGVVKNQSNAEAVNKEGNIIAAVAHREEITKSHIDVDQQKRQDLLVLHWAGLDVKEVNVEAVNVGLELGLRVRSSDLQS